MKNRFIILFLSYIYILHDMPMLGYLYPAVIYALIVVILFLMLIWKVGIKNLFKIIPIFLIPLLDIFIKSDSSLSFFQGISGLLQMLILPLLTFYIYKYNDIKTAKKIFLLYIGINLITCFTTYIGCQIFPGVSRMLAISDAPSDPNYNLYLKGNIGGFAFIYNMVLFSILPILTIKNYKYIKSGKWYLFISIIYLVGIILAIVATEYTTAILMLSFSFLLLFLNRRFSFKRLFVLIGVAIMSFYMLKPIVADGLAIVSENIESRIVSHRLYDLSLALDGKHTQENSDLDAREEKYTKSLNLFYEYPFGVWKISSSGGHSYIFDSLAKYGILGLFLLIVSIIRIYVLYIKPLNNSYIYGYAIVILFFTLFAATINPHLFTNIMMFAVPTYAFILRSNEENNFLFYELRKKFITQT